MKVTEIYIHVGMMYIALFWWLYSTANFWRFCLYYELCTMYRNQHFEHSCDMLVQFGCYRISHKYTLSPIGYSTRISHKYMYTCKCKKFYWNIKPAVTFFGKKVHVHINNVNTRTHAYTLSPSPLPHSVGYCSRRDACFSRAWVNSSLQALSVGTVDC